MALATSLLAGMSATSLLAGSSLELKLNFNVLYFYLGTPSEYSLVKRHPSEKLFGVQLAGGFADTMSKAAQILVDEMNVGGYCHSCEMICYVIVQVDFIDVNMGCPIDIVNQKGGGCALPNREKKMIEGTFLFRYQN